MLYLNVYVGTNITILIGLESKIKTKMMQLQHINISNIISLLAVNNFTYL